MSHIWEQLVLGGVGAPRILILRDNWCTNPMFTKDNSNWVLTVGGIEVTLPLIDNANSYGIQMANILYTADNGYADFTYDYGESIADKIFFFCVNIISDYDFTLELVGSSAFGLVNFDATSVVKKCFVIATATDQTGNSITLRIHGSRKEPGDPIDANLLFDNIYFSEVLYDITLPQPHDSGKLIFNKGKVGENTMASNLNKEFRVRWVPLYESEYFYISLDDETNRQLIAEAPKLFCIPHTDLHWGFLSRWNGDFSRDYSFGEYVGHKGNVSIQGEEYFINKPNLIVGV